MNFTDKEFNEVIARHRDDERAKALWSIVSASMLAFIIGAGVACFVLVILNME